MNCPFCGKRLSMARKWRNKEQVVSYGIDGEVVSVFEPGEISHCPGMADGCKFKIFTALPAIEADRRRAAYKEKVKVVR